MRLTYEIFILGMVLAVAAAAQDNGNTRPTLDEVNARLAEPDVLRGHYSQTRQIALLSRPLESSGQFLLSERGLYWRQEDPFESVLIVGEDRLVQRLADGPPIIIDSAEQPVVLSFSEIFLGLFRGDQAGLQEHFSIQFEPGDEMWEIALTPTTYPLTEAISSIVIRGRQHIDQLSVFARAPDEMIIRFFDLQTRPEQLTEYENELYDW